VVGSLIPAPLDGPVPDLGRTTLVEDLGYRLRILVDGEGGWIVVSDTWVPGWMATVNGRTAPILPVDGAFRGVAVPRGTSEVVLRYRPWSSGLGAAQRTR